MKKLFAGLAAGLFSLSALAQNYPSPTFNSITLQNPLSASGGGTGVANSSTITLGGNLVTSGANPLTFTTTGTTNITLPTSGTILNSTSGATAGANSNITSLTGLTTPLSLTQGGTGQVSQSAALTALLGSSTVPVANGGTAAVTASAARTNLGVAASGANTDITSLSGPALGAATATTAAQFDNTTKVPTTAFVQRALGNAQNIIGVGSNTTLTASQTGDYVGVGAATATLPSVSATAAGSAFHFSATAPAAIVQTASSDLINIGNQTVSSMMMNPGDSISLVSNGAGWYAEKTDHKFCQSILDYGGNNQGSVDNSAALTATIAASGSSNSCVFLPPGTYAFSGNVSYTLPSATASVSILGAGIGLTKLYWAAGGGLKFSLAGSGNSVHIRDMSFLTGAAGTGNPAISFSNTNNSAQPLPAEISDVTNVSIHGVDGYALTDYWSQGIFENSWSNINFTNVSITGGGGGGDLSGYSGQGVGVYMTGSSGSGAPPQGVQFNFSSCLFTYLNMGIQYNNWTQGVAVSLSNFVGGKYGIYVNTPSQGQDQLTVIGSQFNDSDAGIYDNIGIAGLMVVGNYFFVPTPASGNAGIQLAAEYEAVISGNVFQRVGSSATGTNGLIVGSNLYAGTMITGNVFTGLGSGIFLQSTSSGNNVQSNSYHANSTNIFDSGTSNVKGGGSQ
jgi:hypothetical protein